MNKIERLTSLLSQFPSMGKKSALRLVYFLLKKPETLCQQLAEELATLHQEIHACEECGNLTEVNPCEICTDFKRNTQQICVVGSAQDIIPLELSQSFFGLYHVLGGLISPLDGIGPEKLTINKLEARIKERQAEEVILATSPTLEGEATARYIYDRCKLSNVRFTRIAQGMPMGGDFEYVDKHTIAQSLQARGSLV